jgi:hypothetical protein
MWGGVHNRTGDYGGKPIRLAVARARPPVHPAWDRGSFRARTKLNHKRDAPAGDEAAGAARTRASEQAFDATREHTTGKWLSNRKAGWGHRVVGGPLFALSVTPPSNSAHSDHTEAIRRQRKRGRSGNPEALVQIIPVFG